MLQKIQTLEQEKWAAKLQGFNFEIFYKPGKSIMVADVLSRKYYSDDSLLFSLSSPITYLLSTLREFYAKDIVGQKLVIQIVQNNTEYKFYKLSKGLLYYKDRLLVHDI